MNVFLVRHGEMIYEEGAELNLNLINSYATGTKQGPLSERGVRQAQLVADYLTKRDVKVLYSSAFVRARQTAEETSKILVIPVEVLEDLRELNVGRLVPEVDPKQAWTFNGFSRLHELLPYLIGTRHSKSLLGYFFIIFYFRSWYKGRTLGGESRQDALKRIENAFRELTTRLGPSDRVAVFTHGYFIHLLVNHILDPMGAPLRMLRTPYIRNGSVTELTSSKSGKWKIKAYAYTTHLR